MKTSSSTTTALRVSLLLLILASVSAASVWLITRRPAAALAAYWTVPAFDLVSMNGQPFTSRDLQGQIWIADFIFTHCAGTCPAMTSQMVRVDRELPKRLEGEALPRLISFTVDPARDTQEVLLDYARQYDASERWTFVTGARQQIVDLAANGFKLATGDESDDFIHSSRFVLIDRQMQIRGFYDGLESEAVDRLINDAVVLAKERP